MNIFSSYYSLPETQITYEGFEKQLTELKFKPDGSFIQKFELLPSSVPVEYDSRNGSFSGWWVTLESKHIFQYETAIRWSVYACETGHPQSMYMSPIAKSETCSLALYDRRADVDAFVQILPNSMNRRWTMQSMF